MAFDKINHGLISTYLCILEVDSMNNKGKFAYIETFSENARGLCNGYDLFISGIT